MNPATEFRPHGEKILVVEDDVAMARGLSDNLAQAGYTVRVERDGEAGLNAALEEPPDLLVLDLMLPKINGYEVCRELRVAGFAKPVLMLTAKSEESDVVLGLHVGADDYVTKPFSVRELRARIEALLRRCRRATPRRYGFGPYELDLDGRQLLRGSDVVELSPREFDLLVYLVENEGRALSRDQILQAVWGYGRMVGPRSVDRFVTTLRAKIEPDPAHPAFLHTLREVGYKFCPPPGDPD